MISYVPSVEIDGSLGDSEGVKESGSKKRYCSLIYALYYLVEKNRLNKIYFLFYFLDELGFTSYFLGYLLLEKL